MSQKKNAVREMLQALKLAPRRKNVVRPMPRKAIETIRAHKRPRSHQNRNFCMLQGEKLSADQWQKATKLPDRTKSGEPSLEKFSGRASGTSYQCTASQASSI